MCSNGLCPASREPLALQEAGTSQPRGEPQHPGLTWQHSCPRGRRAHCVWRGPGARERQQLREFSPKAQEKRTKKRTKKGPLLQVHPEPP